MSKIITKTKIDNSIDSIVDNTTPLTNDILADKITAEQNNVAEIVKEETGDEDLNLNIPTEEATTIEDNSLPLEMPEIIEEDLEIGIGEGEPGIGEGENYDVAGLGNVFKSININKPLKDAGKEPDKYSDVNTEVISDKNVFVKNGNLYMKGASEEEQLLFSEVAFGEFNDLYQTYIKKTLSAEERAKLKKIEKFMPLDENNVLQIGTPEELAEFIVRAKKFYEPLLAGPYGNTVSTEELFKKARAIGNDKMIAKILKLKPGKQFDAPEEVLLSNIINLNMLFRLKQLAQSVVDGKGIGNIGDAGYHSPDSVKLLYAQQLEMFKEINANVVQSNANIGRSLGALGKIGRWYKEGELATQAGVKLLDVLDEFPGLSGNGIVENAQAFLSISDIASQSRFAKNVPTWKAGKFVFEAAIEMKLMSLLSSFKTDVRNFVTTAGFGIYTNFAEPVASAALSALRKKIYGSDTALQAVESLFMIKEGTLTNPNNWYQRNIVGDLDDVNRISDSIYRLQGMGAAWIEAFGVAGNVLKSEKLVDASKTKIDTKRHRALSRDTLAEIYPELAASGFGTFIDIWGKIVRGKGRLLLGNDEFFKTLNYRAEIYSIAAKERDTMLAKGFSMDQANARLASIMSEPDDTIKQAAIDAARTNTFTADLDGYLGMLQGPMSSPLVKLEIAFFKTPANILERILERTPLAVVGFLDKNLVPKFYADAAKPGAKRDAAMGKMMLGTATIAYSAKLASGLINENFVCTGAYPEDKATQSIWKNQKIPAYSCGIKNPATGNWTYVSYESFEPLSAALMLGATYADRMKKIPDNKDNQIYVEDMLLAYSYAIYNIIGNLGPLESLSDLNNNVLSKPTYESKVDALKNYFGSTAVENISQMKGGMLGFVSGTAFNRDLKAVLDGKYPYGYNYLPSDRQSGLEAVSRANKIIDSITPGNGDVLPGRSFFGEVLPPVHSNVWSMVNPFQPRQTKHNDINVFFQDDIGQDLRFPPSTMEGIKLTDNQYDDYMVYINAIKLDSKNNVEQNFEKKLYSLIINNSGAEYPVLYKKLDEKNNWINTTKGDKLNVLNSVYSEYKTEAKKLLLDKYPDLKARINKRAEFISDNPGVSVVREDF